MGRRGTAGCILGYVKGILILVTNYMCGLIGAVYLLVCVPFIFIHQPIQRHISEAFLSLWYQLVSVSPLYSSLFSNFVLYDFVFLYVHNQTTFCELIDLILFYKVVSCSRLYLEFYSVALAGCKIVITGDTNKFPERSLVVMNHRTRFDWLFYWCLADRLACHRYTKVVLKSGLRNVPGFGGWTQSYSLQIYF